MNKIVHLVVPELFLPQESSRQLCAGVHLPALEKILARANAEPLQTTSLEDWLCGTFGMTEQGVAPVTLRADKVEPEGYYWLRADPVHLRIVHDQLVLQPAVQIDEDEAAQLCVALNAHFAEDGLHFAAPHPQRWYLRLQEDPQLSTAALSQMGGRNVHHFMPQGEQGLRWHSVLNEIQMLLHAHPVNEAREQRGALQINGVWLWGGGRGAIELARPFERVCTDSVLARAFAAVANIPQTPLSDKDGVDDCIAGAQGQVLVVWDGLRAALQFGDAGGWRESLQLFEQHCAWPLLQALSGGDIERITLDALQETASSRFVLTRRGSRKFWRRAKRLSDYSVV